jgi:hypothetical protein
MIKTIKKHLILLWEAFKEGEARAWLRAKKGITLEEKVNKARKKQGRSTL